MRVPRLRILIVVASVAFLGRAGASRAADVAADAPLPDVIQYNRDIRPILSESCFACHGFDKNKRKADLRLDTREGFTAKLEDGFPVVPGKPDQSLILGRVTSKDQEEVMPPLSSKKKAVTPRQTALLKKWIEQGAVWEEHWAFQPVRRPDVPQVKNATWVRNPIDAFVMQRLEREGLTPAAEADRVTLIRRVTLDLTGLPPTLQEVDDFIADKSPDAYENVVDRLLGSVRHAERMAMEWLDCARYADTHGYHIDSGRDMTRWREWVIDAFVQNKPYDQFTIEQLAGDLLPNATLDQKIASGFNRNNMVNFEGGAIPEEYRTQYVIDRVNTTGTVWLGLTVGCTQCHDHKFDPITQKDYYQLFAFFNSVPEKGMDGNAGNATPFIKAPSIEQAKKLDALSAELASLEKALVAPSPAADVEQAKWEAALPAGEKDRVVWMAAEADELKSQNGTILKQQKDFEIVASGPNPPNEVYTVTLPVPPGLQRVSGVRLETLTDASLAGGGPGLSENGNIVLTEFSAALAMGKKPAAAALKLARATADYSQQGFDVSQAIDGNSATGWAIFAEVGKRHEAIFELTEPAAASPGAKLVITLEFKSQYPQHQLGRFKLSLTDAASPGRTSHLPKPITAILAKAAERRSEAQADELRTYFRRNVWSGGAATLAAIADRTKQKQAIEKATPTTMVMAQMAKPRDTFILLRGAYDHPGEKVTPGTPSFLPPLSKDQAADRLGLARWLVDKRNPLTSRVTVNRYWQMIFGTGIVKTVEDFGSQGEEPSHREMLDWLASEFMNPSGGEAAWDVRGLIRLYVTSATYRQASVLSPQMVEKDPENRLLAHGSRYRLQAECIRDQALAASGLLDGRVGGASVSPYQPAGLWEELMSRSDGANWTAQKYEQSHGADLYRRTMYTFWKRTCPPPTLATFDAPDRESCTVRRARTNTPLQALVLMNDPTYVEAARKLAERAMKEPPADATVEDRIAFAFRAVVARAPRTEETAVLKAMLEKQKEKFAADKTAAAKILAIGESPHDQKLDQSELAAWATVCSVILNLDEAVTRG